MTLIKRITKGSALTFEEMDDNLTYLDNKVTGSINYIPKFTGTNILNNSLIYDNGTNIGIGTTITPAKLTVQGNALIDGMRISNGGNGGNTILGDGAGRIESNLLLSNQACVAVGQYALENLVSSNYITGIGLNAGGSDYENLYGCTYLGGVAFPSDSNIQNETVIGFEALGNGNDTITLGNGDVVALYCNVTSITSTSDSRDKKNILSIPNGIDFINTLNPIIFEWNLRKGNKKDIKASGFTAQNLLISQNESEIGEYLDLVDNKDEENLKARYSNLIPIMVKSIQDLSNQITSLKEEINILKNK
jgi:hypothetical protein